MIRLHKAHKRSIYERFLKRPLDIISSAAFLIIFSWLYLFIAILVRINLGSPVIFRQERPGKDEKIFTIYKFRTMTDKRDKDGELLPDEQRLTKFGRFLRSTSLDELPEVFNIFIGQMSWIGPRPLAVKYLPYYSNKERHRHDVRPGLSGLAQVNGRNALSWEDRFSYDLYYVNHISFWLDCSIIFKTILKVFKHEDIIVRGSENSLLDFDVDRKQRLMTSKNEKSKEVGNGFNGE